MLAKDSPILGQIRAQLVANRKKFCPSRAWPGQNFWYIARSCAHLGPGQGRILHSFQKVLPILGQAMAELLCVVKKFCPSCAIPRPYGQNFCPSSARPGRKFQYKGKSFARLGPGQGRTFGLVPEVLPILGQARAELLIHCKKFCPSWARPGQNF